MEFTFLPKATERSKQFVRYTIKSKEIKEAEFNKSGFYYIGKNPANIEKLVKLFKRGYASDNIENAKSELKRCLMQEKNTIPEIIFCESQFEFAAIKNFCLFLNNHKSLSSIPVVLDATNLSEMELNLYRKHKLADEITFLQDTDEKSLMLKIQFLKKVKLKAVDLQNESEFKKSLQLIDTTLQSL